jgi:hypothetical protein
MKNKKGINHKKGASHFNFSAKNYFLKDQPVFLPFSDATKEQT